jgi:hypothetical protein
MADKTVNYTQAQESEMTERYEAANDEAEREKVVKEIAEDFGKTVRSVRAKLVRLGVYVAKTKAPAGKAKETKETIVSDIARTLGVNVEQLNGLEKANKAGLTLIRGTLRAAAAALNPEETS